MRIFEAKASSSGDELELVLYGVIGSNWFEEGITATQVERAIKDHPRAKKIRVRLNSPGGSLAEGLAIRATLQQHAGGRDVEAHIDGVAASAASLIAMGADRVLMHEGSNLMLHEAGTITRGDKRAHERALSALAVANEGVVDVYSTRTGIPAPEIAKLMAAETWLTAQRAVELHFADEVVRGKPPAKAAQVTASFDFNAYGYRLDSPEAQHAVNQLHAMARTAPPAKETEDMSYQQRIAIALGLSEGADEETSLSALDARLTEARRDRARLGMYLERYQGIAGMGSSDAPDGGAPKPYAEMTFAERHALKRKDPEKFRSMKDAAQSAPWVGKSYAQMTFMDRHALKRADPEKFRALKNAALEAGEI